MDFFVTTPKAPQSFRVLWSKEEFLGYISNMIDESVKAGCTSFEVTIDADAGDKED